MTNKVDDRCARVTSADWRDFYTSEPMLSPDNFVFDDLLTSTNEDIATLAQTRQDGAVTPPMPALTEKPSQRITSSDSSASWYRAFISNQKEISASAVTPPMPALTCTEKSSQRITSSDSSASWYQAFISSKKEIDAIDSAQRISSSDFINEILKDHSQISSDPHTSMPSKTAPAFYTAIDMPGDDDVLLGRGGTGNNHIGNKRYRTMAAELKAGYKDLEKTDKTKESHHLVSMVHAAGGRFLALQQDGETKHWVEVDDKRARRKASQALREVQKPDRSRRKKN